MNQSAYFLENMNQSDPNDCMKNKRVMNLVKIKIIMKPENIALQTVTLS